MPHVAVPGPFVLWLERQPRTPDLVGSVAAAKILGVAGPHVARLRRQGRMPEPVPIAGTADAYLRSEVEALAVVLEHEREQRQKGGD
jgi:predicted DNA-binding transcriptional regulator AlpA